MKLFLAILFGIVYLNPVITNYTDEASMNNIQYNDNGDTISSFDLYELVMITIAEAEGESELGKRLVIDTILNRVDDPKFPDNIYDVIYYPNAFSGTDPVRMNNCEYDLEVETLVLQELAERTNTEVLYFRTGCYSKYGEPLFVEDHHYFSGKKTRP